MGEQWAATQPALMRSQWALLRRGPNSDPHKRHAVGAQPHECVQLGRVARRRPLELRERERVQQVLHAALAKVLLQLGKRGLVALRAADLFVQRLRL